MTIPGAPQDIPGQPQERPTPWASAFVPPMTGGRPVDPAVKLICFYLPAFHAIPENDTFWGRGFTEWDNVRAGTPRFDGHHQPRVPGELGYYTLPDPRVQRRQIALARQYGISGFCFYFYWFNGRTVLEAPLRAHLDDPALDFPFCVCWANENWTRRWDGRDEDVLLAQAYSESDDLAFIAHVSRYLRDPRYIRIEGRPLLLVYRPSLLPSARATAERWRTWCRDHGVGEICLAFTQAFDAAPPSRYGMDFAVEFAPTAFATPDITDRVRITDPASRTRVHDLGAMASLSARYPDQSVNLWRGVCPGWDNSARRNDGAAVFLSTPERYRLWLENAIADTRRRIAVPDRRLVFINAWNEWGEGAHLEPDARHGHAWLQATREALLAGSTLDRPPVSHRPISFSVVMPVFDTDPRLLRESVESVRNQTWPHWELCICDDATTRPDTLQLLDALHPADARISVIRHRRNLGIAAATNSAMALAQGEFVALLDHDDLLEPDALEWFANRIAADPEIDMIYSDQDKIDLEGRRRDPFFKPDWSPAYLRGVMYVGHLMAFRRSMVARVGPFDPAFDLVQDYEFALRIGEQARKVAHVPRILYHWRVTQDSIASAPDAKGDISALQADAVALHLHRSGLPGMARPHAMYPHRVTIAPTPDGARPTVTVIIPTRNAPELIGPCLDSIFSRTAYRDLEVLVVDNDTTDTQALAAIASHPVRRVANPGRFNFSRACNLGVAAARGEFVILLNNDTEVLFPDWIEQLLLHLTEDDVAVVAPVLVYPEGAIQHAGVALGCRGTADHVARGQPADSDGYAGALSCVREVSAVTAACLMCRRTDYIAAEGFSEDFATHYQDVDFCLRMTRGERRILVVPQARLMHREGASRGSNYDLLDRLLLLERWHERITNGDPYYNPNLSIERLDYSAAARPPL